LYKKTNGKNMKKNVLIVTAGVSKRFEGNIPKQFTLLNDFPVILHTVNAFSDFDKNLKITLVLNREHFSYWLDIGNKYGINYNINVIIGGETRTESVRLGLEEIDNESLVAVHDGVRPYVSKRLIKDGFDIAAINGSAVPVVNVPEALRLITDENNIAIDRDNYRIVQTPQFFYTKLLKDSYLKIDGNHYDDATVFEKAGNKVFLFNGDINNIKITTSQDLRLLELLMTDNK
jgi:2-C-methyl-D-erythritol 4-phosphate cytidylyltransferase